MQQSLEHKRHTLAHLLAQAVLEKYPDAKLTLGPAVDDGFYYDVDFGGTKLEEAALSDLEQSMRKHLPSWEAFSGKEVDADAALTEFAGNPYKEELVREIAERGEVITLYSCGGFTDLCRGGHAEHPAKDIAADSFKLDRVAGAYWRGDEKNTMLTRIYGLAFETKEELDKYLALREEAKLRDHRELGARLDLFHFDEEIGKGLPLWLPKGNVIKE